LEQLAGRGRSGQMLTLLKLSVVIADDYREMPVLGEAEDLPEGPARRSLPRVPGMSMTLSFRTGGRVPPYYSGCYPGNVL